MNTATARTRQSDVRAILLGGFVAGTLDVGAAALISSTGVVFILHVVAGGLLGKAALDGGVSVALLGLVLQWAMSLLIAAVFVIASHRLPLLRRQWLAAGLAYGVVVFFAMNYVVVPVSAWARTPRFTTASFVENLLAMLAFGVIVAWFAQRSGSQPRA